MHDEYAIFSIVPIEAWQDKRLRLETLRVLGALLSFRGKNTNIVWPRRDQIAERCSMPLTKISEATSDLERLGWLKKEGRGGFSKATRYTITVPELVTESVTVPQSVTVTEQGTGGVTESVTGMGVTESVTGKELTKNIPPEEKGGAHALSPISGKEKGKKHSITLRAFTDQCLAAGGKRIPPGHPIFAYAEKVGISKEMLAVAWSEFDAYWLHGDGKAKRKSDWPGTFYNAVKQNRARLWYLKDGEVAQWTTVGEQARRAAA